MVFKHFAIIDKWCKLPNTSQISHENLITPYTYNHLGYNDWLTQHHYQTNTYISEVLIISFIFD